MQTIEIPRGEWVRQLAEFGAVHDGWLVSLDVNSEEIGAQPEIDMLPLRGMTAEHDGTVIVSVGRSATEHLTHVLHDVTRIHLERTDAGADLALQFETADGARTILRFRTAALPETVDGIVRGDAAR